MNASDRLADLILLAGKGMGWTRCDTFALLRHPDRFVVSDEGIYINDAGFPGMCSWNPYENFRHAGMLMRALGIDLSVFDDLTVLDDDAAFWEATDSDGQSNMSGRGDGNTEAAQCAAVCECALKILKARGSA